MGGSSFRGAPGQLDALLARINRARATGDDSPEAGRAEDEVEIRFGVSRRLAVYGTLSPGAPHHGLIAGLAGEWTRGWVHGELRRQGWGLAHGYPAMRWDPEADGIPVALLVSDDLPAFWSRLDRFEGPGYLRIVVPVRRDGEPTVVANLYEGLAEEL